MNPPNSTKKRRQLLVAGGGAFGLAGAAAVGTLLIQSMQPNKLTLQASDDASTQRIDVSGMEPGVVHALSLQGIPIIVLRRTTAQLAHLSRETDLADPNSEESAQPSEMKNQHRSLLPQLFVVNGKCTHLGCTVTTATDAKPSNGLDGRDGFYCRCHAAKFDLAGRVYKGMPAPTNLIVPNYRFIEPEVLEISYASAKQV